MLWKLRSKEAPSIASLSSSATSPMAFYHRSSIDNRFQWSHSAAGGTSSIRSFKTRVEIVGSISFTSQSSHSPVLCKAVSVKPVTEIEGLNVSEDVTQVKPRHLSICSPGFRQYPSCMRSFSEKKFVFTPVSSSYGSSDSRNKVRCRMIFATNDSKNVASESIISESVTTENTSTNDQLLLSSSSDQPKVKGMEETRPQMPTPMLKRAPLTARERLRAARALSKYTESKPIKPAMGSKILDALKEIDKGKKRSGLPEAPTNLFDDSNRGLEKEGWKFQLPGGNDLFVVAFSFVFISTVMFGTTYVVWKVGAIHFNEF